MSTDPITSTQNTLIKHAAALRDRRDRRREGLILIDGCRELTRAIEAGVEIIRVFAPRDTSTDARDEEALERSRQHGAEVHHAAPGAFRKIAYGQRDSGLVAVARRPGRELSTLTTGHPALIAIAERIEKPGNLGAIIRSADGAALDAVIAVDSATDLYGPNVIRASLGTVFTVQVFETSVPQMTAWLDGQSMQLVAAVPDGETSYTDVDFRLPSAILFGAEAHGVSGAWLQTPMIRASVPMIGRADSLNVAATAAVFFYEALRQRNTRGPRRSV
jgi:TrmH family RNA methyltransferase